MSKGNYNIAFVILHYKVIESTVKAVDSIIENCDTNKFAIILVDNASPDNSGEQLKEIYEGIPYIYVLKNSKNMGFSKGNNVGYLYAKHQLKCKYIVLMNNDITIISKNLYSIAKTDFDTYKYAVLGPKIYQSNATYGTINPIQNNNYSKKRLIIEKWDCIIYLALSKIYLENVWIKFRKIVSKLLNKLFSIKNHVVKDISFRENCQFNVALQGCIWIFSPLYVEKFEGLEEVTFMYHEEEILVHQIKIFDGLMMYDPRIEVFHMHMEATNAVGKSLRESKIIKYRLALQSVKDVLKFLREK